MDLNTADATDQLLGAGDIPPVHEVNADGASPFLLTSDHYGRILPRALGDLGVAESELTRHIAWDIGIAGVAERLAKMLDAHLIAQRYSRLVIDCNRSPGVASSIPVISEATAIPRNEGTQRASARRGGARSSSPITAASRAVDRPPPARHAAGGAGVAAQLHAGLCRRRPALAHRRAV